MIRYFPLLAIPLAATGAVAQLQVNLNDRQSQVNAWDALEKELSRTVKAVGCKDGNCSVEALVLDNQAGGDCFEDALMIGSYDVDGMTVTATEVAVKVDSESMAATRYYRALVKAKQPGAQRLCVRRAVQSGGLRFTMTLDRPETAEQLAQATGVQSRNNRSSSELRLTAFVNSRSAPVRPQGWGEKLASLIMYSERRTPIAVSIKSPGGRLAIGHGERVVGYTDKTIYTPPSLLQGLYVTKDGAKVPLSSCAKSVDDVTVVLTC